LTTISKRSAECRAKQRVVANLEAYDTMCKRKERQLWMTEDAIKELKQAIEDTEDKLDTLNNRSKQIIQALEDLIGKNIKRKVIITRTTF
jgi:flagellar biosynthesis/type III secretory pathway chaperone